MKHVLIIAICCSFLLLIGSCSRSDPRVELNTYLSEVPDETRSAKLLALSRELDQAMGVHRQLLRDNRARFQTLNADYDVSEEALRQQIAGARAAVRASRATIIEVFARMRENSSPTEWKRISDLQLQMR